ncbi:MAG: type II toxin-antitoxin system RelE/ParE family toxin, partial [Oscillospiraceae bacterium]|nr:type II toxin-antitoxin system RelE/ParE family toxin [Oscillospiraceae bacterium]
NSVKFIESLNKTIKINIKHRIEGLTEIPPRGDIKPMQGYSDRRFRLRVGKYRIVYKYKYAENRQILYIIEIGSRGDIYK